MYNTLILFIIALIHFYWALGGEYGLDKALPTNSQGDRLLNPSRFMTYIMGFILLGFTYVGYKLYLNETSLWIVRAGWGLAILFFLRAVGDFNVVGIFKKVRDTEFAKYDTWVYVPLCVLISFNFLVLLI